MKKAKDPMTTAALEIVAFEQKQDALAESTKGAREKAIAVLYREAGRIDAMNYQRAHAEFFTLVMLKRVKDAKEYREKLDMTWPQFCESVGVKWRTIDDKLVDLKPFKVEFLTAFVNFSGFDFSKIRLLGESQINGAVKIQGNTIIYDGQEIAITPENKDEIQAVLEKIEATYKTDLETAQADVRASKRLLKNKEDLINKQAKDIDKYEGRARAKDLTPEEDGFLTQLDRLKTGFDGYLLTIEPTRIDELKEAEGENKITPRMRAAYLEALGYMRRQIIAAHDTAVEMFGHDMALEGETWRPK